MCVNAICFSSVIVAIDEKRKKRSCGEEGRGKGARGAWGRVKEYYAKSHRFFFFAERSQITESIATTLPLLRLNRYEDPDSKGVITHAAARALTIYICMYIYMYTAKRGRGRGEKDRGWRWGTTVARKPGKKWDGYTREWAIITCDRGKDRV